MSWCKKNLINVTTFTYLKKRVFSFSLINATTNILKNNNYPKTQYERLASCVF